MKRLVLSLSIPALALGFSACEQHSVASLPPHYQHKLHGHHDATHPKPGAEHPAAPAEKKAY